MTPEQAAELRKPFPKSAIGKLPKGGVMLDYCGHAATTDRLLAVDPAWTWEPMAVDEFGVPKSVGGNLWIRLTVCGVTRIGVGDGSSAKEAIGDAIRNAAMRFGVALDLWSKEELEQSHGPAVAAPVWTPEGAKVEVAVPITDKTRKALFALMGNVGISADDDQRAFLADTLGRPVPTRADLTEAEGLKAGKRLRRIEQGDTDADWAPKFDDTQAAS
ncbi:MAG: hypothetical protein ACRDYZ_12010 [Acidimicrobiales bacterium]